jgi:hypothetical protein
MDILPSARCSFICVLAFIKTRMIRKSGYFASILELRPVSRCHESSRRSCSSSSRKSNCSRGSANCGSLFRTFLPSPEWQAVFAAMVNISVLNSLSSLKPHTFPWERLPHRQVEMVSADILLCSTARVPHQFQPIELQNATSRKSRFQPCPQGDSSRLRLRSHPSLDLPNDRSEGCPISPKQ